MNKTLVAGLLAGLALPVFAQQQITVVNFGGANANAQKKAYYEPFEATGTKVVPVDTTASRPRSRPWSRPRRSPGTSSRSSRRTSRAAATKACSARLRQDRQQGRLPPAAVTDCGIGVFVWSTVMAYNGDKMKDGPKTWADFLGHEEVSRQARHAQGRALQPRVRADGRRRRARRRVQGAGDQGWRRPRAFKKLTELKPNIQWWGGRRAAAAVPDRRRRGAMSTSTTAASTPPTAKART